MNGILPVWKPKHCTSHDVVAIVRRLAKLKKVGHTGTLDPSVEGVLPLCLGKATRVAEYVQNLPKTYAGTLTLGIATDTQDQSGTVIAEQPVHDLSQEKLDEVFRLFTGEVEQVPPMYSAVKVKGRRLYELARKGKEIERKARKVYIYRLHRGNVRDGDYPQIDFTVECSKGTYIRTLCKDIGQALGYPAHMSHLVRIKSGPFREADCATLFELENTPVSEWQSEWLKPTEAGLVQFPLYKVSLEERRRVVNGRPIPLPEGLFLPDQLMCVFAEDEFLALYRSDHTGKQARPVKVFAENR